MAKRRLTDQQRARIKKKQSERIDDQAQAASHLLKGLVVARFSRDVSVEIQEGEHAGQSLRCHIRANITSIAVGDEVVFSQTKDNKGVVVAVLDRRTEILRPDGLGKLKPVAANVDHIFIVIAEFPEPHPNLIDRYLVAAENAGISASIIVNKIDLIAQTSQAIDLMSVYKNLGFPVFCLSAKTGEGMATLHAALVDKISVFVGQSGVGKSSLVNTLIPSGSVKVGALSESVVKGKHTTTTAELYNLPFGGRIIDSPGIREFHLNHLTREQVFSGYRELHPFLGLCQFRNCQHDQEPGCAVNQSIDEKKLAPTRILSLRYILNNQEDING